MQSTSKWIGVVVLICVCGSALAVSRNASAEKTYDPTADAVAKIGKMKVKPGDWPQWGGTMFRNNTPQGINIPTEWDIESKKNIKWAAKLGSQSYGNPVVANGKVYVGTNNGAGYIERYPPEVDLGCLVCFDEATGKFLWQSSSEKLPTGRVHDWPLQGICCAPYVEGDRLWYVTSRGEVLCLDTEGFLDNENDGPFKGETHTGSKEADIVWRLDMMEQLGISQHNMCSCSVTIFDDLLFVITGNGVDESHITIPAPYAPSFVVMDKTSGKVHWTDNSPGVNITHGQWASPTVAVLGGVPQVLFGGGDGYLYSFKADKGKDGKGELLWKFDVNPKESKLELGGRGTRNDIIGTPCIYDGLVYLGVGQDPEHGEGGGHFYCIDPTKRGDVSIELAFNKKDPNTPIPHKRIQAVVPEDGDFAKPNPNSAAVWHFSKADANGDGTIDFEEEMHRTCGTAAIKDGLLFIADFSGILHCLDIKTGKQLWGHDMLAACWGSALIVDGHVYIGDEDGDVIILKLSREKEIVAEIQMNNSVYSTPVVANNTLFLANRTNVFAIVNAGKE